MTQTLYADCTLYELKEKERELYYLMEDTPEVSDMTVKELHEKVLDLIEDKRE